MADKEQRSVIRWEINSPARVRLNYKNSIKNFECVLKDLNLKGFGAIFKKELPPLEVMKLTVTLPNGENFTGKMKVAWKTILPESVLYGFNIISMKDGDKNLIFRLINKSHSKDLVKLWWDGTNKQPPQS